LVLVRGQLVAINQQPGLNPPKKDTINPANLVGEVVSPEQ
jgi:hypothetical protein